MSLIDLSEALAFLDIGTGYFEITAENDILNMAYDNLEDCEDAWDEEVNAGVTSSTSADCKEGSASASLVINAGGVVANTLLATEKIDSAISLIGHKSVILWIKSSKALASGNLQLLLDESVKCGSPEETLNIPALTANTWTAVALTLSNASVLDAVVSVGLKTTVALVENDTILIDAVKATKDVEISDGTYQGGDLASELKDKIDDAFSISSTEVTYDSDYKFTITVESGHTITIDVTASDAALTFGFTKDPTAALEITSDQAAAEDPTAIVQTILNGVDKWVKNYCQMDFESTPYTNELYDGEGSPYLFLKQYPIISVERLAIGRINGIKVHNSNSDATRAVVTVNTTGLVLTITGGVNAGEDYTTLTFALNADLASMVAAIILVGKGWTASVVNSSYAGHASSDLLPRYGAYCGITGGATWVYLEMPDEPLTDFEVFPNKGIVKYWGGFTEGTSNVIVDYTAGYATIPTDLQLAVKMLVKMIYDRRNQELFGVEQFSLGYIRSVLTKEMPDEVREILSRYRKIEV